MRTHRVPVANCDLQSSERGVGFESFMSYLSFHQPNLPTSVLEARPRLDQVESGFRARGCKTRTQRNAYGPKSGVLTLPFRNACRPPLR